MLVFGWSGALVGLIFVFADGSGWKAVPFFCVVGVLVGGGLWAVSRKVEPVGRSRPRPPQTFLQQLVDLALLLLVAPLVLAAMLLLMWGGLAVFTRLLDP